MKRIRSVILFVSALPIAISAQDIIENPAKSLSGNAGRIVELKEVMRIDDTGGDYYFQHPNNVKVAPDGSLLITDMGQLMHFDSNGKFKRNYFKKGQENMLLVQDRRLQKILRFNFNGEFIREFRIRHLPVFAGLRLFYKDHYYFSSFIIPSTGGKALVIDVPYDLLCTDEEGQDIEKLITLLVESLAVTSGGGRAMASIAELTTMPFREKFLVISHTH
jgi:hypothetical protein